MRRAGALTLGLLLGLSGCAKCGAPAAAKVVGVERVLPKGAVAAVVVPNVDAIGSKLSILEKLKFVAFAAQLQGFGDAKGFTDALVGQLGINLRSHETLDRAGIDGARPAGAAVLVTADVVLALPVKDAGRLQTFFEHLAARRFGAGVASEQQVGAVTVKLFSPSAGATPRLGYALSQGFALVAVDQGVGRLGALAAMGEGDSLASDAALQGALTRVPPTRDVYAWLPVGSPALGRVPVTSALVEAELTPQALTVAADAPWRGAAEVLEALQKKPSTDGVGYLPADAFLAARVESNVEALAQVVPELLGPFLQRAFAEGQVDLKGQVLAHLQPGTTVGVSLADRPPLDRGLPTFDLRRTNPFTYVHLSGIAPIDSPEAATAALNKVAELAPRFGAKIEPKERNGQAVFITSWSQGEGVHFAVKDRRVFFGSPIQRLDALLASAGQGPAFAGLGDDALGVAVDLHRLTASVRALPDSAWGLGGFAIKASTVRWLDAVDDLTSITLTVNAADTNVEARLKLSLAGQTP
jgi:hypothetical protein